MELVRGIPVTDYCDQNQLTPRERLELFVTVCKAIQHAHQKGIIHRDVKPSNVLVTSHDGKPVAKVIDFGVAKAIHQHLTERTIYTNFAQMIGTPLYMSPEQAEMSGLDIDTRSDIYSLGVLLYELLTGSTPLAKKRFATAAYDEIRRLIREEEPPRPSQRLSTSETLASLAASRKTEPAKLSRMMRAELDWVVMKALEKDRTRRYETANGLARDLERYLSDEAVEACPPSATYRLRKFAYKNRVALTTAATVALLLLAGVGVSTWQAVRAVRAETAALASRDSENRQRQAAEAERDAKERARAAEASERSRAEANERQARKEKEIADAVRTFLQQDLLSQADPNAQADAIRQLGGGFVAKDNPTISELIDRAAAGLAPAKIEARFPAQKEVQASILQTVGEAYRGIGEYDKSIEMLTRAGEIRQSALGADHPETLNVLGSLGLAYSEAGKLSQAIELLERVHKVQVKTLGADHWNTLVTLSNLARAYWNTGKRPRAIELLEQICAAQVKTVGPDHPDTLTTRNNLAWLYIHTGKLPQAIELLEQAHKAGVKTLGANHPKVSYGLAILGVAYTEAGKLPQAIEVLEQVHEAQVKTFGPDHRLTLTTLSYLGLAYQRAGKLPQAIELLEQV
ncbi:MAG TPA: serine/threonine-protein kinase, partial [Isosphaeraceae bacterium]|nr:serine/threonine-protein kinase [Isosphaeraceae bacterium]